MTGAPGRTVLSRKRARGLLKSFHGAAGWIEPREKLRHPMASKNGGRVFLSKRDIRPGHHVEEGGQVEFTLYSDGRGIGAADVTPVDSGFGVAEVGQGNGFGVAEADDALPEGWERHWSEEHGEHYFWNKATKTASWTRPEPETNAEDPEEEVPKGWQKVWSSEHEDYYYWHKETKKAVWERPKAGGEAQAADAGDDYETNPLAHARGKKAPVLGLQRISGAVVEWQGFFGWIKPSKKLSKEFQPSLEGSGGRVYVNWRDVQRGLKLEEGVEIEFALHVDDSGLTAKDVRIPGEEEEPFVEDGVDDVDLAIEEWAREDARKEIERGGMAAAVKSLTEIAEDADEVESWPLLPGWEELWSEEHGCHYYWHKATKTSSWERPAVAPAPGDSVKEEKLWEGEGAEEGASLTATPITPAVGGANTTITPYTPGIAKAQQEASASKAHQSFAAAQASGVFRGHGWQRSGTNTRATAAAADASKGALTYNNMRGPASRPGAPGRVAPSSVPGYRRPGQGHRSAPGPLLPPGKRPRMT